MSIIAYSCCFLPTQPLTAPDGVAALLAVRIVPDPDLYLARLPGLVKSHGLHWGSVCEVGSAPVPPPPACNEISPNITPMFGPSVRQVAKALAPANFPPVRHLELARHPSGLMPLPPGLYVGLVSIETTSRGLSVLVPRRSVHIHQHYMRC